MKIHERKGVLDPRLGGPDAIQSESPGNSAAPSPGGSDQVSVSELGRARGEGVGGSAPAQLLDIAEEPGVGPERRQILEEQREAPTLAELLRLDDWARKETRQWRS